MKQHPEIEDCLVINCSDKEVIQGALHEAADVIAIHRHRYEELIHALEDKPEADFPIHIRGIDAKYILGALMNSAEHNGHNSPAGIMIKEFTIDPSYRHS